VRGEFVSESLDNLKVLLLGVLFGHAARGDVVQVLKPLEVRAGDTTTVGKHVGYNDDISLEQGLFCIVCDRAIGTLNNNLAVEIVNVELVDSLFFGTGDKDVALFLEV